ncbi:MotA/TolQ/ExbB proton channel family protein [Staphylococcus epidermidis]|nr:MotA/TolQ/ExbB proton channel family protein [Staphylococcus epidermidis]
MKSLAHSLVPAQVPATPPNWQYGISIALYNTAFGLMVAIPALIFWRYFAPAWTAICSAWN